ncbi:glycoside hydrolase family 5 protein [Sphingomonas sp. VNH70]|uniref:glycoside hydrolase family 5 protein n=1 Tax=Sphingomonas silueang TaxID=3156617 RepID=UPI0032B33385
MRHIIAACVALTLVTNAAAQQKPRYSPAPAAVPRTGAALRLGKCINLSNMLEAPTETAWGRAFRDDDMTRIKAKGFTGLRLPVRFSAHAGEKPPYRIDRAFMQRVRHIVDLATANGIAVIVDLHHYEELFDDPAGHAPRFAALWRQVAEAFRDAPPSVYFELINEPHGKLTAANLLAVVTPALKAVRASNPTRPVVIDGPDWAGLDAMLASPFPDDPYVVPTFHFYDPPNFGLDKADWLTPKVKEMYGDRQDLTQLDAAIAKVTAYVARTGRVPFVGEYGAWEGRSAEQRARYYPIVSTAWASAGIQSCAWGYTNTFQLYRDDGGWLDGAVDRITTTTTLP